MHGSLMCGAYKSYIGRATPAQANCPFSCCINPSQLQTISHLFLSCPVAATVTDWLCRLWQAMTGHLPVVSVAALLAAVRCAPSDLAQTQASSVAQHLDSVSDCSGQPANPSDTSEPDAILASSPSSQQASLSSSSASRHGHLARQLALKSGRVADKCNCSSNRPSTSSG